MTMFILTKKRFTNTRKSINFSHVVGKSITEPRNSNDKTMADKCTPLNACFFMRSTDTPQERPALHESRERLSMVACYGKGFALCCVPLFAVFEPVTRYRPKASKLYAVTSLKINNGVTAMIYLFKAVSRFDLRNTTKPISLFPRYTVRINANSVEQASAKVSPFFVILEVKNANA